ncbi:MAG TPA: ATP-dependent zinc metalloprotease FtsH [Candidatus Acidoferrum sp.]|nr:ATP-dependent zinc metalloprotease FtsH [Candidatus Acidoferrum sp.]
MASSPSPTRRPQLPTARRPGTQPGTGTPFWRSRGFWIYLVVLLVLNYLVSVLFFSGPSRITVPYNTFIQQVNADNVSDVTANGNSIQGDFKKSISYNGSSGTAFQTVRPDFAKDDLQSLLTQHNVTVTAQAAGSQSALLTLLISFGPAILLIAGFLYLSRRATSGGPGGILGAFGRSQARLYNPQEGDRVTFNDIAGIDDAKQDLAEVVDFLKEPEKYQKLGAQIPHGILLVGPPGTGKTLLARAVAGESNRPFFSLSASEFVEAIVGVGAARVRDLFAQAKAAAPSIIFIDELDAIGRSRASSSTFGANDEREQTLNQILTEMDGFTPNQSVVVLAATNRPEVLDQALLRPGRFDRRVTVSPPDRKGREAILRIHTRRVQLAPDVDLGDIAGATAGFVGADLRNIVNEAALVAARKGHQAVTRDDFDEAIERSVLGLRRPITLGPDEKRLIAYHESGHALLGLLIPEADPVKKVTIVPRGMSLGVTYSQPIDDRYNYPEAYLRGRITAALGGRAAEEIAYGTVTTGAENDLQQVNQIARSMVLRWGMSPKVGPLNLVQPGDGAFPGQQFSPETANLLDEEVRRIVDECHREGIRMLTENRERLDRLADAVLKKETLDEDEIYAATGLPRRSDTPRLAPPIPPDGSSRDRDLAKDEVGAGELHR